MAGADAITKNTLAGSYIIPVLGNTPFSAFSFGTTWSGNDITNIGSLKRKWDNYGTAAMNSDGKSARTMGDMPVLDRPIRDIRFNQDFNDYYEIVNTETTNPRIPIIRVAKRYDPSSMNVDIGKCQLAFSYDNVTSLRKANVVLRDRQYDIDATRNAIVNLAKMNQILFKKQNEMFEKQQFIGGTGEPSFDNFIEPSDSLYNADLSKLIKFWSIDGVCSYEQSLSGLPTEHDYMNGRRIDEDKLIINVARGPELTWDIWGTGKPNNAYLWVILKMIKTPAFYNLHPKNTRDVFETSTPLQITKTPKKVYQFVPAWTATNYVPTELKRYTDLYDDERIDAICLRVGQQQFSKNMAMEKQDGLYYNSRNHTGMSETNPCIYSVAEISKRAQIDIFVNPTKSQYWK